ncbi:MAG: AraC family transcriptional regulator [Clostridiaceae bacterium]|nr:AraC family transcriptional regulator [Clostridiaceae bacterium]
MKEPALKLSISNDIKIMHAISEHWSMPDFHFHDAFEIYLSMTENVKYFVNDKLYVLKKGDLLVFNNLDIHKTVLPAGVLYDRYIMTFSLSLAEEISTPSTDLLACFLDRDIDFHHCVHPSELSFAKLSQLFEAGILLEDSVAYGSDIRKRILLEEILLIINEVYRTESPVTTFHNDSNYIRIKPILQYVHDHIDNDLQIDVLARTFFIGRSYLCCLFKNVTGFGVNEYIVNRRISLAQKLLGDGFSVSETREAVGYKNDAHFIRMFKKHVGTTPKQYGLSHSQTNKIMR